MAPLSHTTHTGTVIQTAQHEPPTNKEAFERSNVRSTRLTPVCSAIVACRCYFPAERCKHGS